MDNDQQTSPDLLKGIGDTLSNLASGLTGGLLPDAHNQHQGILAAAVTCLFGNDPWQAECWKGATKAPNPTGIASPAARRSDPGTPVNSGNGLHPAAVAVEEGTNQIEARTAAAPQLKEGPSPAPRPVDPANDPNALTPAASPAIGAANAAAQAATSPGSPGKTFLFGTKAQREGGPADPGIDAAITAQAAAARARADALSSSQVPHDQPAADAARALGPQQFNTGKPQIWVPRSEIDARKPAGAVTGARARVLSFKAASISGQSAYVNGAEQALNIQEYRGQDRLGGSQRQVPIEGMVIHHTEGCTTMSSCANASNELRPSSNGGYYTGANYYITRDDPPQIVRWAPDNVAMNHLMRGSGAGEGQRRADLTNRNTLSVEIMTPKGGVEPTPAQAALVHRLVSLKARQNGFTADDVYGHGELTPGHRLAGEGASVAQSIRRNGLLPPNSIPPGN